MQPSSGPPKPLKPDADGNYDSPAIRSLTRVWEDYCEEVATPENVMGVIAEVGNFAASQLAHMERQVEGGASNPDDKVFAMIFEAFEVVLEGCEYMAMEFAPEIPEDVEEPEEGFFLFGFDLVQEGTNQMAEGHKLGMQHIEAMAEVNCPFCSAVNDRGSPKCDRCGRALPNSNIGGAPEPTAINVKEHQGLERKAPGQEEGLTRNYAMAAHLLEGWKAGAVNADQLADFLDQLEANLSGHYEETKRQEKMLNQAPAAQRKALHEALEMTRRGLQMSLDSVAKMRQAFTQEDDRFLFFGLTDLEEASRVLVDAYWANKEAAGIK